MLKLELDDRELDQTTRRAQEIASHGTTDASLEEQYASYIRAAEEMGIPHDAVLQALRERLNVEDFPVEVGDRVFAPSADEHWYTATVIELRGTQVTVRYDSGGMETCARHTLRPIGLAPGMIVHALSKEDDDWWGARVRSLDLEKGEAEVVYRISGEAEALPLTRIRLFADEKHARKEARAAWQWLPSPFLDLLLKLSVGGTLGFLLSQRIR